MVLYHPGSTDGRIVPVSRARGYCQTHRAGRSRDYCRWFMLHQSHSKACGWSRRSAAGWTAALQAAPVANLGLRARLVDVGRGPPGPRWYLSGRRSTALALGPVNWTADIPAGTSRNERAVSPRSGGARVPGARGSKAGPSGSALASRPGSRTPPAPWSVCGHRSAMARLVPYCSISRRSTWICEPWASGTSLRSVP
jgi:hypothetical protein